MGIVLGLGAALSWGLADYFAAVASRRIGALRVVLGFHLAALVPLGILGAATGALSPLSPGQLPFFVAVGAVGWLSYLAFYGALAIGPISVLSPIVSGYAAVTVILAVLVSGERLSAQAAAAVIVTIAGVMIASADLRHVLSTSIEPRALAGVALAVTSTVLLGAFVFGVSYRRASLGWLAPIILARAFAAVFLLAHTTLTSLRPRPLAASRRRPPPSLLAASPRLLAVLALLACADTGGYVCFNLGVGRAATSVVATASAPYSLVPVTMGVLLLGERPNRTQWTGAAVVVAGLVMLGLAQ